MKRYLWILVGALLLLTGCGTKAPEASLYQSLYMVGDNCYGVDLSGNVYELDWEGNGTLFAKVPTTQWVADEDLCHIYYRKQETIYALDTATGEAEELCELPGLQQLEQVAQGYLLYRSGDDWTLCALDLVTLEISEYQEPVDAASGSVLCGGNGCIYVVNRNEYEVIDAWDPSTGTVTNLVSERPINESPSSGIVVGDELYYVDINGNLYSVPISGQGELEVHLFTNVDVKNEGFLTLCGDDLYITGFYDGATTIYRYDPDEEQVTVVGRFDDGVVKSFATDGNRYGAACWNGVDYHTVWGDLDA
jgi:hypothetical protein